MIRRRIGGGLFDWLIPTIGMIAILTPFSILVFLVINGASEINWAFLTEFPLQFGKEGGIFPTIIASIVVVALALAISIPLGISASVYLSEYAEQNSWTELLQLGFNILAGIPSIIFGLMGYIFLVRFLQLGWSIISGCITLAFMLMPIITKLSTEALKAIPDEYWEEALILGATKWVYFTQISIPMISRSIIASIFLSMGRAMGETAALLLTIGSALRIPRSLLDSSRPMSLHILILAKEGISLEKAFGTSLVLLIFVCLINVIGTWLMRGHTDVIALSSG